TVLARTAYRALEIMGPVYGREIFDRVGQLWGKRVLQIFRCRLIVRGDEKLSDLPPGKIILVFNHKSHIDFILNFFALSSVRLQARGGGTRDIHPRYLAAKDHFLNNKFVYQGIGLGRLIEAMDMIFVDRKGKGTGAIFEACETLVKKEVEMAIYPQGTRAYGNKGWDGERRDAGYYTTGSRESLKRPLGHLKKGAAYLAVDTALCAASQNIPVHLVFIGIEGAGTVAPKGSFAVQTETTVTFTVGGVETIQPEQVAGLVKPVNNEAVSEEEKKYLQLIQETLVKIDNGLIAALRLHEKLANRFLNDAKEHRLVPMESLFSIKRNLNSSVFPLIDRIYALSRKEWRQHLTELARLLSVSSPSTLALQGLNDRVVEQLVHARGKESKKYVITEKKRVGM
ncbi:MAG: lysophospholipid acyltransferase family protein, partial [bacterium]|nr:lysophospholipid acyltransferase family protein [bacterium]